MKTNRHRKTKAGRPRAELPEGVDANAFAKWMLSTTLTVETAARLFGVSTSTIYGWRRGNRPPSRTTAAKIARITDGAVPADSWGD